VAYDDVAAERVRRVLSGRRDVVERKMMGGLCFMVAGGMCCSVSDRGLMVHVGPSALERALEEPHVRPVEMRGRQLRGFVRVEAAGYRTAAQLQRWVQRGLDFVSEKPPGGHQRRR